MSDLPAGTEDAALAVLSLIKFLLFVIVATILYYITAHVGRWANRVSMREKQLGQLASLIRFQIESQGHEVPLTDEEKKMCELVDKNKTTSALGMWNQYRLSNPYPPKAIRDRYWNAKFLEE